MFFKNKYYDVLKIKEHQNQKEKILFEISKYNSSYNCPISKTDWDVINIIDQNWFDFSFSEFDKQKFIQFVFKKYRKNPKLINSWFNQYNSNSGSHHKLHNHENSDIVGIYYVELTDKSLRTILVNPTNGKKIIPKIGEGDLLLFKSNIFHESPKNFTDTRKTVIAFNFELF